MGYKRRNKLSAQVTFYDADIIYRRSRSRGSNTTDTDPENRPERPPNLKWQKLYVVNIQSNRYNVPIANL